VLRGKPGIGETALLDYAAGAAASDFAVLTRRGTRVESGLAFAALRGALGYSGDTADRFFVGVALLTLVGELAEKQPVLIVATAGSRSSPNTRTYQVTDTSTSETVGEK